MEDGLTGYAKFLAAGRVASASLPVAWRDIRQHGCPKRHLCLEESKLEALATKARETRSQQNPLVVMRICTMSVLGSGVKLAVMLRRHRPLIDPETQGAVVAILLVAIVVAAMVVVFWGVHP